MWMEPLLGFLGASRDAGGFVRSYLTVLAFAGPVSSIATTFANVLRACRPRAPARLHKWPGVMETGGRIGRKGPLFGPIPGEIPDSPLTRGPKGRSIPLRAKRRRDLPEGGHLENRIPSTAEVKPAGREPGRRTSEIFRTSGRAAGWRRGRPLRTETRWIGRKGEALARQGPGDASERPGAGARPRAKASTESLILAQDERWRRA